MSPKQDPIVLMYHGIISKNAPPPDDREVGAELYDVPAVNFYAQMSWLKDHHKNVIITFDDGEMNNFQEAFPLLKDLGLTGYFFIIVKRIGKKGYMGWKEIKQLIEGGMKVGSHGLTHEILTSLSDSQMEEELKASKRTLELNLNTTIEDLSIPRGFCNDKVIQMAYTQHYRHVFISEKPYHVQSKCLPRIAVKSNWTLKRFQQAVAGHTPIKEILSETLKKAAKTILREPGYNWVRSMIIRLLK